jgi:hypothetical protein
MGVQRRLSSARVAMKVFQQHQILRDLFYKQESLTKETWMSTYPVIRPSFI